MHRQQHAANVCTALELVQQLHHLHTGAGFHGISKSSPQLEPVGAFGAESWLPQ
jgi:hypothetical protein